MLKPEFTFFLLAHANCHYIKATNMFSAQNIDDTFPTTSIFSQLFLSPKIHLDKMCAFQMSRLQERWSVHC